MTKLAPNVTLAAIDKMRERVAKKRKERTAIGMPFDDKPQVQKAFNFAWKAHAGQVRKYDGDAYAYHPLEVARILIQHKLTHQRYLIAAMLHDVLEDTSVTPEEIEREFGAIAKIDVQALTVKKSEGNRKRRLELKTTKPIARGYHTIAVKTADIISNIQDVALHDPKFAELYLAEKKQTLDAFRCVKGMPKEVYDLIATAMETHGEGLNQLALTILAEENEREAKEAHNAAELDAAILFEQGDPLADLALF